MTPRTLSARALFGLVYTMSISSVYFALGVVAQRALGLTPIVFLVAGVFFALASMTYVEGAALHRERGGSSVFARYGFNELVSFVAGWAILLDYAILLAVTAFTATNYLAEFADPVGEGPLEIVVAIGVIALVAAALTIPADLDFLVGIYAFGAMLAFTIAHLSIIRLRYREPDRERPYRVPLSINVRGGSLPLPAVLGALLSGAGWVTVLVLHEGARYVGLGWLLGGLVLYVVYRRSDGNPLLKRVTIPERALRREPTRADFGSVLVPIFGKPLDDDIMQTAGRLAGEVSDDLDEEGATIEAIWVFEVPMSLPIDARLPEAQVKRAQEALRRAKAVGEEYEGVHVQTAMVRARRAGEAIVREARRRGVEAIVLAAEEPSRVRGGALFGGTSGPLDNYVGEVTKHVLRKAACRVILTAPAAEPRTAPPAKPPAEDGARSPQAPR